MTTRRPLVPQNQNRETRHPSIALSRYARCVASEHITDPGFLRLTEGGQAGGDKQPGAFELPHRNFKRDRIDAPFLESHPETHSLRRDCTWRKQDHRTLPMFWAEGSVQKGVNREILQNLGGSDRGRVIGRQPLHSPEYTLTRESAVLMKGCRTTSQDP